jgi:hypothetical protein
MNQPDPMNHSGAAWCDEHNRWECSKRSKRHGGRCHASAIRGTDACRTHAGKRTALAKAQGEAVTAWSALAGNPTVSATDAVLGMLQMSWLRVHLYAQLLEEQVTAAQDTRSDGGGAGRLGDVGPGAGLVGHTVAMAPGVGPYASGEAVRGLAQLEAAERDRCVRFAKTAHDMGIAEHQIRIAEQQGSMLADVIRRVLGALDLTEQQRALVPQVVPRELRAIAGGAA